KGPPAENDLFRPGEGKDFIHARTLVLSSDGSRRTGCARSRASYIIVRDSQMKIASSVHSA
ncbi:MAG TPA: hypothetical protein PLF52_07450, partial [Syntrophales bacterium]|nr:hypothetical protein [Syntrophales bacterium]